MSERPSEEIPELKPEPTPEPTPEVKEIPVMEDDYFGDCKNCVDW
jgi:hypothetical protein